MCGGSWGLSTFKGEFTQKTDAEARCHILTWQESNSTELADHTVE